MKKTFLFILMILAASCGSQSNRRDNRIISVSIAPFKYFVEEIAGDIFDVNVMVPAGSNPHIYEPFPDQVRKLRTSEAYISDGFLGFEITWLDRFYEMNRDMKKLSLGSYIEPISAGQHSEGGHTESADPHYWVSPACASRIAVAVKEFLSEIDTAHRDLFEKNYMVLNHRIEAVDSLARGLTSIDGPRIFMIYHPNLAYLARDYGLQEVAVEFEGKEPSPARIRYLIDLARKEQMKIILVQKEYDARNARAIADEAGAHLVIIDPLSEDWIGATTFIINTLKEVFETEII